MKMGMMSPSWAFLLLFLLHLSVSQSSSAATPDLKDLALSALDLLSTYSNQTLVHSGDLMKNAPDPVLFRRYGTCIEAYKAAVSRQVPAAITALKSGDYAKSKEEAGNVALDADACEQQWATEGSPMAGDNKMVRELSVLASSMVGLLG